MQHPELLKTLKERFTKYKHRHPDIGWDVVERKLMDNPSKLESLRQMEETEGEPDVISYDSETDTIIFADCSAESPKGRRSLCYDEEALESRKLHKPEDSALHLAQMMGVEIMDEQQYIELQKIGEFDIKTSSWLKTPTDIRQRGGAIFGDRRYGRVFIYHNGAESYYAARGFRAILKV